MNHSTTNLDQWVIRIAAAFILTSVALAFLVNIHFLWFTIFVGVNLLQTSFTGFCPLALVLKQLGVKPGQVFYKNAAN